MARSINVKKWRLGFFSKFFILLPKIIWFLKKNMYSLEYINLRVKALAIGSNVRIDWEGRFGNVQNLSLGDNVYIGPKAWINSIGKVSIGSNTRIGPNFQAISYNHSLDSSQREKNKKNSAAITIGDNNWIGSSVIILSGVETCDNVVIAAGAVVTKSINYPGIYAGVPAKLVKLL